MTYTHLAPLRIRDRSQYQINPYTISNRAAELRSLFNEALAAQPSQESDLPDPHYGTVASIAQSGNEFFSSHFPPAGTYTAIECPATFGRRDSTTSLDTNFSGVPHSLNDIAWLSSPAAPCHERRGSESDSGQGYSHRRRTGRLPSDATDIMKAWISANIRHPYPTAEEKRLLAELTGLSGSQISNYLINARRRQPILRHSLKHQQSQLELYQYYDHLAIP